MRAQREKEMMKLKKLRAREVIVALKETQRQRQGGLSPTGKADRSSDCCSSVSAYAACLPQDAACDLINERKEQIEVPPCADRLQAMSYDTEREVFAGDSSLKLLKIRNNNKS